MSASNGGLPINGQQRDLMIQAAVAYDDTQKRIATLEDKLNRAVAALQAKNAEIDNLNLMLSQERNRNDNYRNERDQAVANRAEVLSILSNVRAMLEKTPIPMHLGGTRNGKIVGSGNVAADNFVADNGGEQLAIGGGGNPGAERRLSGSEASRATLAP